MSTLRGTGVSPGIAVGPALIVEHDAGPVFRLALDPGALDAEVERLEQALAASAAQLEGIKMRLEHEVGAPNRLGRPARALPEVQRRVPARAQH